MRGICNHEELLFSVLSLALRVGSSRRCESIILIRIPVQDRFNPIEELLPLFMQLLILGMVGLGGYKARELIQIIQCKAKDRTLAGLVLITIDAGNLQPRGTFVLCIVAGAQDVLIKKM